ncbi:MAG: universal stress protein [Syntrophobacteraceae bacterium]
MEEIKRKRILVSVDGSQHALDAVHYVSKILSPQESEIILFHVITKVPESFWDLEKEPAYHYRIANVCSWEAQQEKMINVLMAEFRQVLLDAGFPEEAVTVKIQGRKIGIARDITAESLEGYDAVVVGRKGLSQVKDLVLGSTADRLMGKLLHIPMWIVGNKPYAGKLLLPVDASEGAMQAVTYVSQIVDKHSVSEITLFHAIRGMDVLLQGFGDAFALAYEQEWIERAERDQAEAEKEIEPTIDEAKRRLLSAGFDPSQVKQAIVKGVGSRPGAIIEEAQRAGIDTIVVGRRGLSKIQEFFIGRVSKKVVHLAREQTVWIVS